MNTTFLRTLPHLAAAMLLAAAVLSAKAATHEFGRDGVTLEITTEPESLSLDRDLLVTLALSFPSGTNVRLPSLDDRFEGFRIEGSYEGDALSAAGVERRSLHLRARPVPGAETYRIAPFAVSYSQVRAAAASTNAAPDAATQWFPTRPIAFAPPAVDAVADPATAGIDVDLEPIAIRPSARRLLAIVIGVFAACAAVALLAWAARHVRRRIRIARMSPRERAFHELMELIGRDLPSRGRTKEFYVALTLIVRRHPAFSGASLDRLRAFLTDADRVKFAGKAATPDDVSASVASARAYLDAEPPDPTPGDAARRGQEGRP